MASDGTVSVPVRVSMAEGIVAAGGDRSQVQGKAVKDQFMRVRIENFSISKLSNLIYESWDY